MGYTHLTTTVDLPLAEAWALFTSAAHVAEWLAPKAPLQPWGRLDAFGTRYATHTRDGHRVRWVGTAVAPGERFERRFARDTGEWGTVCVRFSSRGRETLVSLDAYWVVPTRPTPFPVEMTIADVVQEREIRAEIDAFRRHAETIARRGRTNSAAA